MKKFIKWCFINLTDMFLLIFFILLIAVVVIGACIGFVVFQSLLAINCICVLGVIFESWLGELKEWAFEED